MQVVEAACYFLVRSQGISLISTDLFEYLVDKSLWRRPVGHSVRGEEQRPVGMVVRAVACRVVCRICLVLPVILGFPCVDV